MTAKPFIECRQLVKIFKVAGSEVMALQGLDLTVEKGEIVAVVGASGSGKSTLMGVLAGLVRPTGGTVRVADRELTTESSAALESYRREMVGVVWHDPAQSVLPYLDARANVALALELQGRGGARTRADELLESVGLGHRARRRPKHLSGGEAQRLALAVALAPEPTLLLADEPTGALDRATTRELLTLLRTLTTETGLTQVVVTHDDEVADFADRVVAIRDGRVQAERRADGSGDELSVIDNLGRLQLTDAQLASLGDSRRVTVHHRDGLLELVPESGPAVTESNRDPSTPADQAADGEMDR